MNIAGLLHININCSDFERSKAFYELLGFREIMPVTPDGEGDEAAAVGMPRYRVRGALMKHPSRAIIDFQQQRIRRARRRSARRARQQQVDG